MDLSELKRILKKSMILNATAMADIRSKPYISLEGNADYQDRYRRSKWYARIMDDIDLSEKRYDDILDRVRMSGAGKLPERDSITGELDNEGSGISQDDRGFLKSCGIKTERGETWTP